MKTVLIGASTNPDRYAYKATISLQKHGHELVLLGIKEGEINGNAIQTTKPLLNDVDTITLYIGPQHQAEWTNYLLSLKPRRIIFNPGTENEDLELLAQNADIETIEGCTLVMLSVGTF
jgi:uncharacterized protein